MNKRSRRALTAVKALRLFTVSGCSEFAAGAVPSAAGIMVITGVLPDAGLGGVGIAVIPLRQVSPSAVMYTSASAPLRTDFIFAFSSRQISMMPSRPSPMPKSLPR